MATKKKNGGGNVHELKPKSAQRGVSGVFTKELPVKLSDKERRDLGDALAADELMRQRILDEKSAALTKFGERLKEVNERIAKTASEIDNGEAVRLVPVQWHDELAKHEKYLVRNDTMEEIDRRPMNNDELQNDLGL